MKNIIVILIIVLFLFSCSASKVSPPKIDLRTGGRIGVITFKVENARGVLDEIATEILVGHLKKYYEKSEIILLGKPEDIMLKEFGLDVSIKTLENLCREQKLDNIIFGKIIVSNIRANMKVKSLLQRSRISAKFRMTAELNLYIALSGNVTWKGSSYKEGDASYDHYSRDLNPDFYVSDKDESYRKFVRKLIYSLTEDFRSSR
ncbi:MAG: hypothetical protein KAS21_06910 [Candidatus Aminicenantes bacterium]|nr:hypothetical protein [Candidatus Aminicenantes bacterium]MCK5004798.1 hypothetical protein [Candidatus Aminicenantes bacterium]